MAAIDAIEVSPEEVNKVLALEEGHFADLKAIDIAPGKLTRSLSALSNAEGGELFIGIDEDSTTGTRVWRGFANPEAANAHIQVLDELFPSRETATAK